MNTLRGVEPVVRDARPDALDRVVLPPPRRRAYQCDLGARTPHAVTAARVADLPLGTTTGAPPGIGVRAAPRRPPRTTRPERIDLDSRRPGARSAGVPVFDAASWNGIAIDSTCGGHGTCKKCKVRFVEGNVPVHSLDRRAFSQDQLDDGWRLACVARTNGDPVVDVPPLTTRPKAATFGVGRQVILRPAVQKRFVELSEPSLTDQRTDSQRVFDELDRPRAHCGSRGLPHPGADHPRGRLQSHGRRRRRPLVAVEPGDTTKRSFGLAFDLGTTTVVANLMDITTGTPAAVTSMLNKQQPYGADVIARISATMLDSDALGHLQQLAHETLDGLAKEACAEAGVEADEIYEVALAGNATMVQLALGINPEPLGVAPFILAARQFENVDGVRPGTRPRTPGRGPPWFLRSVPTWAATSSPGRWRHGMDRDKRLRLFVDIGTNCEIVIGDGDGSWRQRLLLAQPSRPRRSAAECARPPVRSRWSRSPTMATRAAGHR